MPIVINELETLDDPAPEQETSEVGEDTGLTSLLENQQTQKHWQLITERQERLSYD